MDVDYVGFAVGRGWVVGNFGACWCISLWSHNVAARGKLTLRTSPSSLPNIETAANSPAVGLAALCINKALFGLDDCTWLALVIHAQYLGSDLELAAVACYGERLQELNLALSIKDVLGVKLGHAFDWCRVAARVEINDFLIGMLEREDDGVGWEGREGRMELLVRLLGLVERPKDKLWHCAGITTSTERDV